MWSFNPFRWRPSEVDLIDDTLVIAQLNARLLPFERGEYFEDPLDAILKSLDMGEVTGGGTQMAEDPDGIAYCVIEISLPKMSAPVISLIVEELEKLGAPKGSVLKFINSNDEIAFGKYEGLGLFLNGTDLPSDVYALSDVNDTVAECNRLLEHTGAFRGYWEGRHETALYFYGKNFVKMRAAIQGYLDTAPLCSKARVVRIA